MAYSDVGRVLYSGLRSDACSQMILFTLAVSIVFVCMLVVY